MKYFLDTEFIEGPQKTWWGGKTKPTIDLISIGIVAEDGREYYAISKDFNLKEAWNRYDLKEDGFRDAGLTKYYRKEYWIRENVIKPLMQDAMYRYNFPSSPDSKFRGAYDYKDFKWIIQKYGKSNDQIAKEVMEFVGGGQIVLKVPEDLSEEFLNYFVKQWEEYSKSTGVLIYKPEEAISTGEIQFYTYYGDYDWVVFCWLFGRMIDLPSGFPMYSRDLKQMLDEKDMKFRISDSEVKITFDRKGNIVPSDSHAAWKGMTLKSIEDHPNYPKKTNEHNALADAKWNYELYKFLQTL